VRQSSDLYEIGRLGWLSKRGKSKANTGERKNGKKYTIDETTNAGRKRIRGHSKDQGVEGATNVRGGDVIASGTGELAGFGSKESAQGGTWRRRISKDGKGKRARNSSGQIPFVGRVFAAGGNGKNPRATSEAMPWVGGH